MKRNQMKNSAIVLISTVLLSTGLMADDVVSTNETNSAVRTGWYIGLGAGASSYGDGGMGKEFDNFSVQVDKGISTGFKLYSGYKFNTIVGVEASYIQYGTFSYKSADSVTTHVTTKVKPKSLNVAANLGYDFFNDQLRPYGLIGLGYIAYNQGYKQELYTTDGSLATVYGFGVEYTPTLFQCVGFRLQFDSTVSAVGVTYSDPKKDNKYFMQSFNMLSLNAQYRF